MDIRNHQNLLDSMEQYVKGDLLEGANAYHCEKCNKKVRLTSQTQSIDDMEGVLNVLFALRFLACSGRWMYLYVCFF